MVILLIVLIVLVLWIIWGNSALMTHEITIENDKIPDEFSGYRIAQVSDLHNALIGKDNEKLVEMLADTDPDIIVLTGDLVDSSHTDIEVSLSFAARAAQIAPTYYVTGNHETWISQFHRLKKGLEDAGVVLLQDEATVLEKDGASISLLGIDDPSFQKHNLDEDPAIVASTITDLMPSDDTYTILLSHRPEFFDTYVTCGVDLVFTGHAHGGQIRLPFVGGILAPDQGFFPKYDSGLYTEAETSMVVSRGIGNSVFPFRVNNRPEIVVVELKS